jgi:hypothetical protein
MIKEENIVFHYGQTMGFFTSTNWALLFVFFEKHNNATKILRRHKEEVPLRAPHLAVLNRTVSGLKCASRLNVRRKAALWTVAHDMH